MELLSVRDLSVAFETRDGIVQAVNGVSFSLDAGTVLALLGESGSGKSVTLRAILGLHAPARARVTGEVWVKGRDVNQLDAHAREDLRGGVVSMVFQEPCRCRRRSGAWPAIRTRSRAACASAR